MTATTIAVSAMAGIVLVICLCVWASRRTPWDPDMPVAWLYRNDRALDATRWEPRWDIADRTRAEAWRETADELDRYWTGRQVPWIAFMADGKGPRRCRYIPQLRS